MRTNPDRARRAGHADEKFPLCVIVTDVIEFDRDGVVYE